MNVALLIFSLLSTLCTYLVGLFEMKVPSRYKVFRVFFTFGLFYLRIFDSNRLTWYLLRSYPSMNLSSEKLNNFPNRSICSRIMFEISATVMFSRLELASEIIPLLSCYIWWRLFKYCSINDKSVGRKRGSSVLHIEKSFSRYRFRTSKINCLNLCSTDLALTSFWNYSRVIELILRFLPVPCLNICLRWDGLSKSPAVTNITFNSSRSKVPLLSESNFSNRIFNSYNCIFSFSVN